MNTLWFAVYLTLDLFWGSTAQASPLKSSKYVRQDSGFVSANVGDNVTLHCFYEGEAVMFYWYKQTLGHKPRLISTYYKHEKSATFQNEFKSDSHFTQHSGNGNNHLTISNLRISDSATYYCLGCYSYDFEFVEGVTVSVAGSGVTIRALVHQSSSEIIQPGGSMTLNCTVHTGSCGGEHSVYWFKTSQEETQPGLIYTHGGRNDQCERKDDTQTHTCIYNLPMESLNVSHAGTYYCAVASCGHILFGDGTKLDMEGKKDSLVLAYFLSGALAFNTILVIVLAYAAYTINNTNRHCTDSRCSATLTSNPQDYEESADLHYAALRVNKVSRSTRQRDDTKSECVYSSVRQ